MLCYLRCKMIEAAFEWNEWQRSGVIWHVKEGPASNAQMSGLLFGIANDDGCFWGITQNMVTDNQYLLSP